MKIIIKSPTINKKEYYLYRILNENIVHILSKNLLNTACGQKDLSPNKIDNFTVEEIKNMEYCYKCLSNCGVSLKRITILK